MKRIVITGVNRGLGKELLDHFYQFDYELIGVVRAAEVAPLLRAQYPKVKIIVADLGEDHAITILQREIGLQAIDLLINNAGIPGNGPSLDSTKSEEILSLLNVHCLGVLRSMKALKPMLLLAKEPMVINLNSRLGSITRQDQGDYAHIKVSYSYRIAKAAQNMLTACLKSEFGGKIKFISLHPGKMKTEIAQTDADLDPAEVARCLIERYAKGLLKEEPGIRELNQELIEW